MGTLISSFLCVILLTFTGFVCLHAHEGTEATKSRHHPHHHIVQISSLIPSATCSDSKGPSRKASLTVVHRYGPCSQLNQDNAKAPTYAEILEQDESRVKWINSKFSKNLGVEERRFSEDFAEIPAKSGATLGYGNYVVTVALGTPSKDLTLAFDTGSELTWTQCKPCVISCYKQKEQIFDPRASGTYKNITCNSPSCSQLTSGGGIKSGCSASTCLYGIPYGDQSFSVGFFAKERLALTPKDVFNDFLFGCGQYNRGLFVGIAGLMGLSRSPISLVEQTAASYGRFFSYCLPSTPSATGHLTFGKSSGGISNSIQFTPLSKATEGTSFYGLDITGIFVGGRKLEISSSVFTDSRTIIDSGTVITRLPPAAYSALRTAFRKAMEKYPLTKPVGIFDTCYDFTKYKEMTPPKIAFSFGGGVNVEVPDAGVFSVLSISQVCLAFAGNANAKNISIFGNTQQKTLEVVYDVAGGRVGFGPGSCK